MLLTILLAGATLAVSSSSRSADDNKSVDVITKPGNHRLYDGRLSVELTEKQGKIHCWCKRKLPEGMPGDVECSINPPFEKNASWFVFPQSDHEVWTFNGRDILILTLFGEGHPENVSWHQGGDGRKMPEEVRDRLPKEFLEKLEKKRTAIPR